MKSAPTTGQVTVLRGIGRSAGCVEGEALVTKQPLGFVFCVMDNETGTVRLYGHELGGISVAGKILVYPTDVASTGGAVGLYYKAKFTRKAPLGLICRRAHPIAIAGALAGGLPVVDALDRDPLETIKTGDRVRIVAERVGGPAMVEIRGRA